MGMTDPIADMLTRIRNGAKAGKKWVNIPSSKLRKEVARILAEEHFIKNYQYVEYDTQDEIRVFLRYDSDEKPIIRGIKRISKPGLRMYSRADNLPRVLNGLGIAIISTSSGVMTDREARVKGVGGEVICYVW
ncbi:MAG: 30S ribosomal protein S8 [Candidatus Latescibacteria bacterium]|jgi:small subunit ribosomal protein S8|nr:30S ribosomal protein S8 [Candidatus Latescibacterota bacterium]